MVARLLRHLAERVDVAAYPQQRALVVTMPAEVDQILRVALKLAPKLHTSTPPEARSIYVADCPDARGAIDRRKTPGMVEQINRATRELEPPRIDLQVLRERPADDTGPVELPATPVITNRAEP